MDYIEMDYVKQYTDFLNDAVQESLNEWVKALLESTKNPYDVLGIPQGSDLETAKAAYRRLSMKHHPDRNQGDKASEEIFKEISAAYEMIKNPGKNNRITDAPRHDDSRPRQNYDQPKEDDWERGRRERQTQREKEYAEQRRKQTEEHKKWKAESDARMADLEKQSKIKMENIWKEQQERTLNMQMETLEGNCKVVWKDLKSWKLQKSGKTLFFTSPNGDYTLQIDAIRFSQPGMTGSAEYKVQVLSKIKELEMKKDITGYPDLSRELSALQKLYREKNGEPEKKGWFSSMFR